MKIIDIFNDAFKYTNKTFFGDLSNLFILFLYSLFIVPILGHMLKIMRGEDSAPDFDGTLKEIYYGMQIFQIGLAYSIIPLIIALKTIPPWQRTYGQTIDFSIPVITFIIISLLFGLLAIPGFVRYAKTQKWGDALRFWLTFDLIRRIGLIKYFCSMITLELILIFFMGMSLILILILPIIGLLIQCITTTYGLLFVGRLAYLISREET
ncbi:DUF4013 domain-containing protein [uncultured Methanospirillum sp.]|uniref:DUF4013 domain-containing protein n=1 Tax=uncultured Methanospirillum sp. TaxID=262503 RepID=UPI0029C6AA4F|nr:DUF4013 domain-containing protein [uncultured Methanospirillum sp.]